MTTASTAADDWLPVAQLLRPQGRRGELLADVLCDIPGVLIAGRQISLAKSADSTPAPTPRSIESLWNPTGRNAGRVVLKLSGIDSINDAETVAGHTALILRSELPALDADTWLVSDLIGCTVVDSGRLRGTITDVEFPTTADGKLRLPDAAPLFAVIPADAAADTEPVFVPFVRAWLDAVDLHTRRVTMHLPDGLFSTDAE